jgi:glycosyltransferase involved in cell wall biosynthesis
MISVILTTYKRPDKLKRAIESVLNQSYKDFELIIVDDNSKDGTEEMVSRFPDKRIVYIKRTKNFGCDTKPKNEGIMASNGDYMAFLDDDNEYRPDHLLLLLKAIEEDDKFGVVYGDRWLTCDVKDENWMPPQMGISSNFSPDLLMKRNYIDTSDVLIKRDVLFAVGGFDERYKKYIDWNLWVRMTKFGIRMKRVPMVITDYHLHQDMKSVKVKTKGDSDTTFAPEWDPYDCEIVLPYLGKTVEPPRVAIFSLTYDRLEYTKKSFKSLEETAGFPFDHYVVDNGSTDGTQEWLTEQFKKKKIKQIRLNEKNVGISKASNEAIEMIKHHTPYDCIVKWDNDCIGLTKNWLTKMVEIWQSNRRIALSCYVQGLVDNPGGAVRVGYGTLKGELIGVTKHLGGICHFVDAHAYDDFKWEENSFLHGIQDMEMSQYLLFHGWSQGYMENYYISHGPKGTAAQKKDFSEYFERRVHEKQTRYAENP